MQSHNASTIERPSHEPDGVPHHVVALTIISSLFSSAAVLSMIVSGNTWSAVFLAIVAVPAIIVGLAALSQRARDQRGALPGAVTLRR